MSVQLSEEAHDGWGQFARTQRVSVTALVEAVGLLLAEVDPNRPPSWLKDAIRTAAQVDDDRKRRTYD